MNATATATTGLSSLRRRDRFTMDEDPTVWVFDVALHDDETGVVDLYAWAEENPYQHVRRRLLPEDVAFYLVERRPLSPELVASLVSVRRTKDREGFRWQITAQGLLTNSEAAGITFRAEPGIILGEHVTVEDAEGVRIGIIKSATYMERILGPAYVLVTIELR